MAFNMFLASVVALCVGFLIQHSEGQISEGCPTDVFVSRPDSNYCYIFGDIRFDWFSANSECTKQFREARLASVNDQAENDYIAGSFATSTVNNYWIGLYKIAGGPTAQLVWIDGSPSNGYKNFEDGEPDEVTDEGNDCVAMNEASGSKWSDETCTDSYGYVCKTKKFTPQTGTCPSDDWQLSGTTCYYVDTSETASFTAAAQSCRDLGGDNAYLVSIRSQAENNIIYNMISGTADADKNVWIGLDRCGTLDQLDNDWFWYDETPVTNWAAWAPGQPDGEGDCAAAGLDNSLSEWEEIDCSTRAGVYCKALKADGACPSSFVQDPAFPNSDICYYVNPVLQLTQTDAQTWCAQHASGASLGSITGDDEQNFLNILAQSSGSNVHSFWIGLYRYVDDAPWTWRDQNPKAIVKWAEGEPTNDVASDLCATTGLFTGAWYSASCDVALPYVCKAQPNDNPSPGDCMNGFELYGTACYLFVGNDTQTQENAFQACKKAWDLSSLVSLVTTDEHEYVYQRMVNATTVPLATDYWIGYLRCDPGDQILSWLWLDNGQVINADDYNNFILPVGEESCAMMDQNGNWTDYNCNEGRGYACEVSAVVTTTARPATTATQKTTTAQAATTTTTSAPDEGVVNDEGLSSGDIVGIVFGVLIAIALIGAAGIFGYIYVLKPRMGGGMGSNNTTKDTTAFAFSNTSYSDQQDQQDGDV